MENEDMMYEVEGEFFLELCSMYFYAYFILLLPLTGMAYQKKSSMSKHCLATQLVICKMLPAE